MSTEERRTPHPAIIEALGEIKGELLLLKDRQESAYERLFGNGQPGELHHIKHRVSKLEKWMWGVVGGGSAVVFIIGIILELRK